MPFKVIQSYAHKQKRGTSASVLIFLENWNYQCQGRMQVRFTPEWLVKHSSNFLPTHRLLLNIGAQIRRNEGGLLLIQRLSWYQGRFKILRIGKPTNENVRRRFLLSKYSLICSTKVSSVFCVDKIIKRFKNPQILIEWRMDKK